MGNYYPGSGGASAAGRSEPRSGGTINLHPSQWRRITTESPKAANDNIRIPRPANDNYRPSIGPPPAYRRGTALPWWLLATMAGWAGIYMLNKGQQAQPGSDEFNEWVVDAPGTSWWGNANTDWCEATKNYPPDAVSSVVWMKGDAVSCIGGQAVPNNGGDTLNRGFWSARGQVSGRYQHIRSFQAQFTVGRPVGNPPQYVHHPAVAPVPAVAPLYWVQPGTAANPNLAHRPWGSVSHWNNLDPGREAGYGLNPLPTPTPAPVVPPKPFPGKERKAILAMDARSPLGRAINAITETGDVLDCAHKALAPSAQAPRKVYNGRFVAPSVKRKAAYVWNNADKIDLNRFLACMVDNMVEDGIFGYAGALSKKANRSTRRFGGLQLGPAL